MLDGNRLGKLSGSVGIFHKLRVLSLSANIVEMLPEELAENKALTDLQLDGNKSVLIFFCLSNFCHPLYVCTTSRKGFYMKHRIP